jgi:hypothetical protein
MQQTSSIFASVVIVALLGASYALGCADEGGSNSQAGGSGAPGCGGHEGGALAGEGGTSGADALGDGGAVFDCDTIVCSARTPANCSETGCCALIGAGDESASCIAKSCSLFSEARCPLARCDLIELCSGALTCSEPRPPGCGPHGAIGAEECCPGLERRCGGILPGGSCDLMSWAPACLACGDDTCETPENHCNCPEDCVDPCALP